MSYQRSKSQPMEEYVNTALAVYNENVNEVGAGYSIIRYVAAGLIQLKSEAHSNEFLDWFPLNQSYTILRMALAGKLEYKSQ